jgi:putative NIF3 family GTP cyclohydrolase 1 type 2
MGTGTFFGTDGTNPTIGQVGRREEVSEWRLEVIVPESKVRAVIAAMRTAHSYEEPAFDVYPLVEPKFTTSGEGRIGERNAITLGEFATLVKSSLHANTVMMVGDPSKLVRRVAIACGAAGEFLNDAIRAHADVFVVGELRFHDALTAESANVGVLVPGHYATERPAVDDLATRLTTVFPSCEIWASRRETDPLTCI